MHRGYVLTMRHSPLRHPLAILRTTIGATQKEMGQLAGRAARTIQSIELGHLPLTEELALRIAEATGIDETWLLEGNPEIPPRRGSFILHAGRPAGVYTREDYEFHRAVLESPVVTQEDWAAAIAKAQETGNEMVDVSVTGLARARVIKKQLPQIQQTDVYLADCLQFLLDDTMLTQTMFLARWKIRKFFDELAKDLKVNLPKPEMTAQELYADRLKWAAKLRERTFGAQTKSAGNQDTKNGN